MYVSGTHRRVGHRHRWFLLPPPPDDSRRDRPVGPDMHSAVHKYYVDEIYERVRSPAAPDGEFCHGVDRYFINGILC